MNYGWIGPNSPDREYSRVVIHEFGHALGMVHEHQSPAANIPWDKDKVYIYYKETNGWDKETVDRNIFRRYSSSQTNFSSLDKNSIMMYPIPNELTIGDYQVGWNTVLSDIDKDFISEMYPKFREDDRELVGVGVSAADV